MCFILLDLFFFHFWYLRTGANKAYHRQSGVWFQSGKRKILMEDTRRKENCTEIKQLSSHSKRNYNIWHCMPDIRLCWTNRSTFLNCCHLFIRTSHTQMYENRGHNLNNINRNQFKIKHHYILLQIWIILLYLLSYGIFTFFFLLFRKTLQKYWKLAWNCRIMYAILL